MTPGDNAASAFVTFSDGALGDRGGDVANQATPAAKLLLR